jgi:hypothetical protein
MEESVLISHEAFARDIAGVLVLRHRIAACLDEPAWHITGPRLPRDLGGGNGR